MKRSISLIYGSLLIALACLCGKPVYADTGLAMRCDGATAATQAAACTGPRTWLHPGPSDYILTSSTVPTDSTTVSWTAADLQFRKWIEIPGTTGVLVCTKDLSAAQAPIPAGGTDNCAPGSDPVLKKFVPASTVTITPPVVLTNGTATLEWKPPTANADGSPLTDLKGFDVYQGASPTTLVKITTIPLAAGVVSYVVTGLASGTYYFGITALDAAGNVSDLGISNQVTATKTVNKQPGKPTEVTATISATVP